MSALVRLRESDSAGVVCFETYPPCRMGLQRHRRARGGDGHMKALLLLLPNLAVLLGRLLRDPGVPRTAMDEVTWVLAALLDYQNQLVFLDDPGCLEGSVLKKTFWTREWLSNPVEPKPCSCGDGRCKGCLVITLHDSYAGPGWKLTFRG